MSAPASRAYHRPTVQALGTVRDLTRNVTGSFSDSGGQMMVGSSDERLKYDIQPLLG